ncbi:hypothetical protein [Nocardia sp. NPDC004860]|uniref:hypothetical protein n=1 Tax=Nocardia sp. NPDC004860 TaxID=3154557 RepID=UPI0033A59FB9
MVLAAGAVIGLISALMDLGGSEADLDAALNTATVLLDAIIEQARKPAGVRPLFGPQ